MPIKSVVFSAHSDDLAIFLSGCLPHVTMGFIAASPLRIDHLQVVQDLPCPQHSLWGTISESAWKDAYLNPSVREEIFTEEAIAKKVGDVVNDLALYAGLEAIYTHNPIGEYSHIHHRRVSAAVCNSAIQLGLTVWSPSSIVYIPPERPRWHFAPCGLPVRHLVHDRRTYWDRRAKYLALEKQLPSKLWTWTDTLVPPESQPWIKLVDKGQDLRNAQLWQWVKQLKPYGLP